MRTLTDAPDRNRRPKPLARRVLAVAALIAAASVAGAPAASAHTVGGNGATNFSTRLTSFGPDIPDGITLRVVENGSRIELDNRSTHTVTVLGYGSEPYLRVGPTGVDQNQRSTATYLNTDRYTVTTVPAGVDNTGTVWKHVSDTPVALWHDHRVHWMSASLPVVVAADPAVTHQVYSWTVKFLIDGHPATATGTLNWTPGPSPLPYYTLIIAIVAVLAFALWRIARLSVLALTLLTLADITHTIGVAADQAQTTLLDGLIKYPALDILWLVALAAAALIPTRREHLGLVGALLTAGWMTLVGGLADLNVLASSTAPFAWPISLDRLLTALETGIGLSLLITLPHHIVSARNPTPTPSAPGSAAPAVGPADPART